MTDKNNIRSYLKNNRFVFMTVNGALSFKNGFLDRGQDETWKTMGELIESKRRLSNWSAKGVLSFKEMKENRKNAVIFTVHVIET